MYAHTHINLCIYIYISPILVLTSLLSCPFVASKFLVETLSGRRTWEPLLEKVQPDRRNFAGWQKSIGKLGEAIVC